MLYDEITQLIATHREDDWWDFKREHHHDKAELVHDILWFIVRYLYTL